MNKMLSERLGDIFISTGANLKAGTSEITEDEALDIITYNDTKNVLIEANKYINKE